MKKQKQREKISLTIDIEEWNKFKKYCESKGYKYSTRINILINMDVAKDGILFNKR